MRTETLTKVGAARSNPRMSGNNNQLDATPNRNGSFHNPARRLHHSPLGPGQENLSKIENGNNTITFQTGQLRQVANAAEGLRFGLMHAY